MSDDDYFHFPDEIEANGMSMWAYHVKKCMQRQKKIIEEKYEEEHKLYLLNNPNAKENQPGYVTEESASEEDWEGTDSEIDEYEVS